MFGWMDQHAPLSHESVNNGAGRQVPGVSLLLHDFLRYPDPQHAGAFEPIVLIRGEGTRRGSIPFVDELVLVRMRFTQGRTPGAKPARTSLTLAFSGAQPVPSDGLLKPISVLIPVVTSDFR